MRIIIERLAKNVEAVNALLTYLNVKPFYDTDADDYFGVILEETSDVIDFEFVCNGIIVRDDLITIEFPDGSIADYEIKSNDYCCITIS
jgi:hypothetical protein